MVTRSRAADLCACGLVECANLILVAQTPVPIQTDDSHAVRGRLRTHNDRRDGALKRPQHGRGAVAQRCDVCALLELHHAQCDNAAIRSNVDGRGGPRRKIDAGDAATWVSERGERAVRCQGESSRPLNVTRNVELQLRDELPTAVVVDRVQLKLPVRAHCDNGQVRQCAEYRRISAGLQRRELAHRGVACVPECRAELARERWRPAVLVCGTATHQMRTDPSAWPLISMRSGPILRHGVGILYRAVGVLDERRALRTRPQAASRRRAGCHSCRLRVASTLPTAAPKSSRWPRGG